MTEQPVPEEEVPQGVPGPGEAPDVPNDDADEDDTDDEKQDQQTG